MIGAMSEEERYGIVVVGGATAGAEAARVFSERGILTVVLEQNSRPYGKIEDGLPRWHVALRKKEYGTIDGKLRLPHVHFVPGVKLGRHVELRDIVNDWGFHAVVLAHGAWRDRPLAIEGADSFVGKGLVYQNPFIYWFNHYTETGYEGDSYDVPDGTIVVGGGLASIDVAKVLQLELTLRALRERGIEEDLVEMEVKGIPSTLDRHGLSWKDLGLRGSVIYYRRRVDDMPLVDLPEGANDKAREKVAKSRRRVLDKAMEKYLFRVEPLHLPVELIVEGDRLVGLKFARTRVEEGRAIRTDRTVEVRAPMIISSIGSVPEALPGIPMRGELYDFLDWELGRLEGYPGLFSAGNVVTGKGNIVASRKHAKLVSTHVTEEYVRVAEGVNDLEPFTDEQREKLLSRVRELQGRAGYDGDYDTWIRSMTPPDLD
jgi:NADPH-dependent glutamate synthase beta subunit-like oxidoreductase